MTKKKQLTVLSILLLFIIYPSISYGFDNTYLSGNVVDGLSGSGGYHLTQQWDIDSDGTDDMQTFCYAGTGTYMKSINNATSYEEMLFFYTVNPSYRERIYYASDINTSRLSSGGSSEQRWGSILAMRLSSGKYAHVHGWTSGANQDYCHFESAIQNDGTATFSSIRLTKEKEVRISGITDGVVSSPYIFLLNDSNDLYRYYRDNATLVDITTLSGTSNRRLELNDDRDLLFTSDNRTLKIYNANNLSLIDTYELKNETDPYYNETDYGWYITDIEPFTTAGDNEYVFLTVTTNNINGNRGRIVILGLHDTNNTFEKVYLWYVPNNLGFSTTDTIIKDIELGDYDSDGILEMAYGVQGWDGSNYDYFIVEEFVGGIGWNIDSTLYAERVPSVDTVGGCTDTSGRTGTGITYISPAYQDFFWNNNLFEWQYHSQPCYEYYEISEGRDWGGGLHEIIYDSLFSSSFEFEKDHLQFRSFILDTDGDSRYDTLMGIGKQYSILYEIDSCAYPPYLCLESYNKIRGVIVNDDTNTFGMSNDYIFRTKFSDELISPDYTPIDMDTSVFGNIYGLDSAIVTIGSGGFIIYSIVGEQSAPTITFTSNNDTLLINSNYSKSFTVSDVDNDEDMNTVSGTVYYPDSSTTSADYLIDNTTVYMILDTNTTLTQTGSYYIEWQVSDAIGNTGYGTYYFTVADTNCASLGQAGSWACTSWSPCYIEAGESIKSRTCQENYDCGFSSPTTKQSCEVEDLPDEPDVLECIPRIIQPSTESYNPSITSQTPTGFACFTNWYGYDDSYISYMTYTINGETNTVYPNESTELCGKSESCIKHRGFIQTWDYVNNYFTEYDDVNMTLSVSCYCYDNLLTSISSYTNTVNIITEYENFCYGETQSIYKECFAYGDDLANHILSSKDLNLLPNAYSDLDRAVSSYNTPDKQMYRMTTDIINYFSDEAHINDAKDLYYKISRNQGYQIFDVFPDSRHDGSVYVDMYITDIYPKWVTLTNSDGKVQILILFYDNSIYYYDGYTFKAMGEYLLDQPFRFGIIFDSDNRRFKAEVVNWFMNMDDANNIIYWKKIGTWEVDKQGTYVETTGAGDPIRYLGITMTSELCNTDSDCNAVLGNQQYYAGVSSTAYPEFSSDFGFKLTNNFKYTPNNQFTTYFDDAGIETFSNMTLDFGGTQFTDDSTISLIYKVEDDSWCVGDPDYSLNLFVYDSDSSSWTQIGGETDLNVTNYNILTFTPSLNFTQVRFGFKIYDGYEPLCYSKGSIGIDAIRVVNVQNTDVEVSQCRNLEWFENTFTNSSSASGHWGHTRMVNNSQFMNEFGDYDINDKLNLDNSTYTGGYCYSEFLIDNVESSEKTTFRETGIISGGLEGGKVQLVEYEWLSRLGWRPQGDAEQIEGQWGGTGYLSQYYDYSVCKEDGRNLNAGNWCIAVVHFEVGLELITEWIYGNFISFMILLIILMIIGMSIRIFTKR